MNRSHELLTALCLDCDARFDLKCWRRLSCPKGWRQSPDIDDRIHRISADDEATYRVWRRSQRPNKQRYNATHDEHARAS